MPARSLKPWQSAQSDSATQCNPEQKFPVFPCRVSALWLEFVVALEIPTLFPLHDWKNFIAFINFN